MGDVFYIMFAMDLEDGCYLGLGKTTDFEVFDFLGIVSGKDNRNGVLFPEKIGGKYLRLDRPNKLQWEGGPCTGNAIFVAESDDLIQWHHTAKLFEGSSHYWDEFIGPGTPPIKTRDGWLCVYHGIAMHYQPIYQAGVFLLDLHDPTILLARGRYNILEPRELYETTGQVPNVCFPTGIIVEKYDSEGFALPDSPVKIYYGAADTSVAMATTTINKLLGACYAE
jgi:beta-1,4-mannooligosaccharide/beta-1,4-mannosyl-N-acetylglucosamine phosphorylase